MMIKADLGSKPGVRKTVEIWGLWSSHRSVQSRESQIVDGLETPLIAWRHALWARTFADRRLEIREDLIHAWFDGQDPQGQALTDASQRRAWLLERWLNTADSDEGQTVRADIEIFIDDVVQTSPTPLTATEIDDVNRRRQAGPALDPVGA